MRTRRRARKTDGANVHGRSRYNEHNGQLFIPGDHWVECQRCGLDVRQSNTQREWSGNIVCAGCYDPRQPQDFVRGTVDDTAAKGLVRPTSGRGNDDTVSGSTSVPSGTFNDDYLGTEADPTVPEEVITPLSFQNEDGSDMYLWLDFADNSTMFSDTGATTLVEDGDFIMTMNNKAEPAVTNGWVASQYQPTSDDSAWAPIYRHKAGPNSKHVGDFDNATGNRARDLESDTIGTASHPVVANAIQQHVTGCTVIVVAKVPIGHASDPQALWGGTNLVNAHHLLMFNNATSNRGQFTSQNNPTVNTTTTQSWSLNAGDWFCFWMEFKELDQELYYNNATASNAFSTLGHDCNENNLHSFRIGTASTSGPGPSDGWKEDIGEVIVYSKIFDTADRLALYTYLQEKWALSAVIGI